ncbi:MAG: hypothetical protein ACOYPR_04910 [Saprospiraceae bacterium]
MILKVLFYRFICLTTIYTAIIAFNISCASNNDPNKMEISLLEPWCHIDTFYINSNILISKKITFLVNGYRNTAAHEAKLDSFICASKDSTWINYKCVMPVFKKSKYTNNENVKRNHYIIYDYSYEHDYIGEYHWSKETGFYKVIQKGKEYVGDVICKEKE